ncbi:MarR family winged helix-turn-helix transcriptional regulator [Jiella pacifica]|uniref:MarR family transcriptional regulator n=1 Tax=Jiella pacifica TaxID=2696469 RepID=A0A6N9T9A7_9HYPH|nr:MarR family winged helix-turn-helix transcriptional regulator [Jiella pacifica]NDW08003.1 MarR family transcriptional regulator [Jiella pacifica]
MPQPNLTQADYSALAEFRYLIRRFLEFSEAEAKSVGLTARQHQALLVIKGYGRGHPIAVGDLADRLRIRPHSAVELVNRLSEGDLVVRLQDSGDQRRVLLQLTARAEDCLAQLSAAHLNELSRIHPMLSRILERPSGQNGD